MSRSPSNPSRKKFAQPAANGNGMMSSGSANFAATMSAIATISMGTSRADVGSEQLRSTDDHPRWGAC